MWKRSWGDMGRLLTVEASVGWLMQRASRAGHLGEALTGFESTGQKGVVVIVALVSGSRSTTTTGLGGSRRRCDGLVGVW